MRERYQPEGSRISSARNRELISSDEGLARAHQSGEILEARAIRCDADRNLIVDLGGRMGIIPRAEAAAGEDVRDIAIISQVGKFVCFKPIATQNGVPILSRRAAQEEAIAYFMRELMPGDVLPMRVTHLEPFGAFVDIGCGVPSLIGIENISISRISHPSDRFEVGQTGYAAVLSVERDKGRINLTHRELLGSWEQNAERFGVGETVAGVVRGVEEYGAFIELAPNLSGLTERREGLEEGDGVSVYIKSINPERMKIKLLVIERLDQKARMPLEYFITDGHIDRWRYSPEMCDKKTIERVFDGNVGVYGM